MTGSHFIHIAVLFAGLSAPVWGHAEESASLTFRRATKLIEPYLVLTDRAAQSARTAQGRAQLGDAVEMLNRVIEADPGHWPSLWFMGKAHQALRDHPAAYKAFKQSLALNPSNPNVAREFVIEAICTRATAEAVAAAREVANANASDAGLQANLGLALLADGQVSEARATTERALSMSPSDSVTKSLLAEIKQVQAGRSLANYCPP